MPVSSMTATALPARRAVRMRSSSARTRSRDSRKSPARSRMAAARPSGSNSPAEYSALNR